MKDKDTLYAKWLNGEVSDDEIRDLEGDDALAELKRLTQTVDNWSMPKYDTSAGYQKFKQTHQPATAKIRRINWFAMSGIAASLLLLVYLGYNFLPPKTETLFAGNGQTQSTVLSDGSEISLNDGSTVKFKPGDWEDQRSIDLTGEALFEVTKGSPFTVNTTHGSIRVLGTQFNVRAWGKNLYVECYEGSVEVTANNLEKTILKANEAVNIIGGAMSDAKPISNNAPLWKNATSRFYNDQLQTVFEELERQYDVKVITKTLDRTFSGNFKHDDLESALQSICKPLNLTFKLSEDKKTITIE